MRKFSSSFTLLAQIILAEKEHVKKITNICRKAGIDIDGIVPNTLAERNLVLDLNELNDNVMLIDIGAGNTDIGIFNGSSYIYTNTLPLGGDNVTNEMYKNIAENCPCDVIMYTNVTSPLISDETIIKCINLYREKDDSFDSINTANFVKEFLWLDGKPINYDPNHTPKSQDLPDIAALNFAINIIERDNLIKRKHYIGSKPYLYIVDRVEAIDIDDMIDFEFAEFMYKKLRMGK